VQKSRSRRRPFIVRAARYLGRQGEKQVERILGPGTSTWLARKLDELASYRVLEAMMQRTDNFHATSWMGTPMLQFPIGAWLIQEVVYDLKPQMIIETGTFSGGSAYYLASLCDLVGIGEVISIDVHARSTISHPRITYIQASSTDPQVIESIRGRMCELDVRRMLVMLDSDHSAEHVSDELEAFAPMLPIGSYIHVQDGCVDQLPRFRSLRPGPTVAVRRFLSEHHEFVRDIEVEGRYWLNFHPYGWLKRVSL
jgi:cephalosporin hydroxylase